MANKKLNRKFMEGCRSAIRQLVVERDPVVCDLVLEEVEDYALGKLMEKSAKGAFVSESKIMKLLKRKVK